jgi:uncharacterized membrane protein
MGQARIFCWSVPMKYQNAKLKLKRKGKKINVQNSANHRQMLVVGKPGVAVSRLWNKFSNLPACYVR